MIDPIPKAEPYTCAHSRRSHAGQFKCCQYLMTVGDGVVCSGATFIQGCALPRPDPVILLAWVAQRVLAVRRGVVVETPGLVSLVGGCC